MVTCLMLTTETSLQVWYVSKANLDGQAAMECLFCKVIPEVCQVDFVHLPELGCIDQEMNFGSQDEFGEDREILASLAPLIAYVTHDNKTSLNVYSLAKEQAIGTIQTTAAIRKFSTSLQNPTYKLTLM